MHSDGLSTRQSHCSGKKSTAQRGREGGRLSPLLRPYSLFCLLCFTHYLQSVSSQSPSVSYPSWAREERTFTNRHWRISTIMSPLWGHSFSLYPAMLPSSSLSPGQSPFRGKATWGEPLSQRSRSRRDSWAPLQSLWLLWKGLLSSRQPHYISFLVGTFALFQFFSP